MLAMMGQLVPEDVFDNIGDLTRSKGEINVFSKDGEGLNYPQLTRDFISQYEPEELTPGATDALQVRFSLMPSKNHPLTDKQPIAELPRTLESLRVDFPWLRAPYFTENVHAVMARKAQGENFKGPGATFAPSFNLPSARIASFYGVPIVYFDKGIRAGVADTKDDTLGGRFVIE
jgi:hypothetical protein